MGNVELCGGPTNMDTSQVVLLGHIKNSQTRALMAIMESCRINYNLQVVVIHQQKESANQHPNTQGNQG